jgi:hypothetical protein
VHSYSSLFFFSLFFGSALSLSLSLLSSFLFLFLHFTALRKVLLFVRCSNGSISWSLFDCSNLYNSFKLSFRLHMTTPLHHLCFKRMKQTIHPLGHMPGCVLIARDSYAQHIEKSDQSFFDDRNTGCVTPPPKRGPQASQRSWPIRTWRR